MAKTAKLAAYSLEGLHEPLGGVSGGNEPPFTEPITVDGGVVWQALTRKRELLKPYPMRLRESQIAELRELEARGVVPAEFIRAALDDALRRVRESGGFRAP